MDENTVRDHAQAHADAVVAGDLRKASGDLTDNAKEQAPAVMKQLPRPTTSATIEAVTADGDEFVASIRYLGESDSHEVRSRWTEEAGRPMIKSFELD